MKYRTLTAALAASVIAVLFPGIPQAAIHTIGMSDYMFLPTNTTVHPGDTVRWILNSGVHTTTSDATSPKSWNSGTMSTMDQHFDVVLSAADGPGPFPYHCTFHQGLGMVDTIHVATPACCHGTTGDVDQSGSIDISDLQMLIDYLFFSGSPGTCFAASDVDRSGSIDISDLQA
ncbi:MAG TPA: dockerin type I domain-containing protein [Candidatus Acidoferrum sp.]|nr:dockerin type I domain-containing protein [Candidatus Acidoferrum sp.]